MENFKYVRLEMDVYNNALIMYDDLVRKINGLSNVVANKYLTKLKYSSLEGNALEIPCHILDTAANTISMKTNPNDLGLQLYFLSGLHDMNESEMILITNKKISSTTRDSLSDLNRMSIEYRILDKRMKPLITDKISVIVRLGIEKNTIVDINIVALAVRPSIVGDMIIEVNKQTIYPSKQVIRFATELIENKKVILKPIGEFTDIKINKDLTEETTLPIMFIETDDDGITHSVKKEIVAYVKYFRGSLTIVSEDSLVDLYNVYPENRVVDINCIVGSNEIYGMCDIVYTINKLPTTITTEVEHKEPNSPFLIIVVSKVTEKISELLDTIVKDGVLSDEQKKVAENIVREYIDLKEKHDKLSAFLHTEKFSDLGLPHMHLLIHQEKHMKGYLTALRHRLELFGIDIENYLGE